MTDRITSGIVNPFPAALVAALIKAQAEFRAAPKESANLAFRSRYADLATIVETIRPVLAKHGLGFVQSVSTDDGAVTVCTTVLHTSGETWTSPGITIRPAKLDAHGIGSATTYAKRYDVAAVFGVVADDDDDGNASSAPQIQPAKRQAARPAEPSGPINLDALRARVANLGHPWSALVEAMGGTAPETWQREDVTAALDRLGRGGGK